MKDRALQSKPVNGVPETAGTTGRTASRGRSSPLHPGGNFAVQRLLRGSALQTRGEQSQTPDEAEADQIARNVVRSQSGTSGHEGCSCGRSSCPKCAARQKATGMRAQPKEKPATAATVDLDNATPVVESLTGGSPLSPLQRAFFEARFGADFSSVRIHTGPQAALAADRLEARAFTVGSDIVFADGEYRPDSPDGQFLLAHELAHVVQQSSASANRNKAQRAPEDEFANETYPEFEQRVRNRAISRLTRNIEALGEWSTYISGMNDFQLSSQIMATNAREYASVADETLGGGNIYETWAGTGDPGARGYAESRLARDATYRDRSTAFLGSLASKTHGYFTTPSVADRFQVLTGDRTELPEPEWVGPDFRYQFYAGPIERWRSGESGGCQTCHDINFAWGKTAEVFGDPLPEGPAFPEFSTARGAFLLSGSTHGTSTALPFASMTASADLAAFIESWTPAATSITPPSAVFPVAPAPSEANPFLPGIPIPASVEPPVPRSDLCGATPRPDGGDPLDSAARWGTSSAIVAAAVRRIGGILSPLGPRGYQVLPRETFDQLWNATPETLEGVRTSILDNIRTRQENYRELQSLIRSREVPFTELCPMIDELLPSTNADLRDSVRLEVEIDRAVESVIDTILKIAGAAMLVFAIVFPPSIMLSGPMLAASAGLALAGIATGARDYRRGGQYMLGTGSGIYTAQQEAQAESLRFWGAFNMVANAIAFAGSLRALRAVGSASRASGATGALSSDTTIAGVLPGTRATPMGNGQTLIWHPDHLEMFGVLNSRGLSIYENGQLIGHYPLSAAGRATSSAVSDTGDTLSLLRSLPSGEPSALSLLPAPAISPSMTPLRIGGVSTTPGPLAPTVWNPLGLTTNCGFCTISGLLGRGLPNAPLTTADELYIQTLQNLDLPTTGSDPLSRQLIFPDPNIDRTFGFAETYAPLFEGARSRASYTFPSVASSHGLATQEAPGLVRQWQWAFNSGPVPDAAANWMEIQEELGRQVTLAQATNTINRLRADLPGDYAIGSYSGGGGHYMAMEITPSGQMIGLDFQDGQIYLGLEAILQRLNGRLDMVRRVTGITR